MKKIYSWHDSEELCNKLSEIVLKSGFEIDRISPIPRGGWTVAALLAQKLNVRYAASLDISRGIDGVDIFVARPNDIKGLRILLVEDSVDSGRALYSAAEKFRMLGGEVKTACLIAKLDCPMLPDFFVSQTASVGLFPWDK